jgi:hypothetical protein
MDEALEETLQIRAGNVFWVRKKRVIRKTNGIVGADRVC